MKKNALVKAFESYIQAFADRLQVLDCTFSENKKAVVATLYLRLIRLEFVYKKKGGLVPPSTLFCRIYLNKNSHSFFHLPELMDKLDPQDFHCYYYPYIENAARMEACCTALTDALNGYLPMLDVLAMDGVLGQMLEERQFEEIKRILNVKPSDFPTDPEQLDRYKQMLYDLYEQNVLLLHFTSFKGYKLFLQGEYSKAAQQYATLIAKNTALAYESHLHDFLLQTDDYQAMPEACAAILVVSDYNNSPKDGLHLLLAVLLCYLICLAFFLPLLVGVLAIVSNGTQYTAAIPWYNSLWIAGLPALFGGIAFRRQFAKLTRGKKAKEALDFDRLLNSDKVNNFAYVVFGIAAALMILFTVWIPSVSVRFYDEHLTYNVGEIPLDFRATTYAYTELEAIYAVDGLYNDFGDWINRGSYVLVFRDGTRLNLDGCDSVENTEAYILPLLKEYVGDVQHAHTEADIK